MSWKGNDAIQHLSEQVARHDPGSSSHWNKFHGEFKFTGKEFTGLMGFGGFSKPYKGIKKMLNLALQNKFRKIGKKFRDFGKIELRTKNLVNLQNRAYDIDVMRQVITLAFLNHNIPERLGPRSSVLVIGDGFGTMTASLLDNKFAGTVILVNLNKTLLVDLWYLRIFFGEKKFENSVQLVESADELIKIFEVEEESEMRVIAIQAENHEILKHCQIDLAMNIVSMQEMNPEYISKYFDDLYSISRKKEIFFYCCNREEKFLPDGTVTRFKDYPWGILDEVLIDELCPWHQQYYSFIPPFYRPYDGPIRHQIRILKN
jgi:putative sugar O-methyltransferase